MRFLRVWPFHTPTALLLGLALGLAACERTSTPSDPAENGDVSRLARVSVMLTDAPGEVDEAWVKFDAIYLQREDGDEDMGSGPQAGREMLLEDPTVWINLMELTAGQVEELVSGATVPNGFYAQLRFVITRAVLVTAANNPGAEAFATSDVSSDDLAELNTLRDPEPPLDPTGLLHCPSCSRSGLKLNFRDGGLEVTGETLVLADFDVTQSFGHEAGRSGRWVMHPVINAMVMGDGSGSIAGVVSLGQDVSLPEMCGDQAITLADFVPLAESGGMQWSGQVEPSQQDPTVGSYEIANLPPADDYMLGFLDEIEFANGDELNFTADIFDADANEITDAVEVMADATFEANYVITSAECIQ